MPQSAKTYFKTPLNIYCEYGIIYVEEENMKRNIRIILLVAIFVLSLSNFIACASKNAEASPVKYKKDSKCPVHTVDQ